MHYKVQTNYPHQNMGRILLFHLVAIESPSNILLSKSLLIEATEKKFAYMESKSQPHLSLKTELHEQTSKLVILLH